MYLSSAGLMLAAVDAALPSKPSFWEYFVGAVVISACVALAGAFVSIWNVMDRSEKIARNAKRADDVAPLTVKTLRRCLVRVWIFGPLTVAAVAGLMWGTISWYDHSYDSYRAKPRVEVAEASRTAAETLAELAADPHSDVRVAVAANPSTSPAALHVLATDSSSEIRAEVAANPSADDETFAVLAADSDAVVRACVGANHSAPSEILVGLAGDSEMSVRVSVTRNPSASADAISAAVK